MDLSFGRERARVDRRRGFADLRPAMDLDAAEVGTRRTLDHRADRRRDVLRRALHP
jgi:hypothetical protein